jgi:hypothetical protein
MKMFMGLPFYTINTSSRAWFSLKDMAVALGVDEQYLTLRILKSDAGPFRSIRPRANQILKIGKNYKKVTPSTFFDLDFALASAFTTTNTKAREMRDRITYYLNNLFYDGFVSLKNYHLDLKTRRAITAYVCGVDHYLDIVKDRWDSTDPCRGARISFAEVTLDRLVNPDYYLDRDEVTKIKAIDLALYLLDKNSSTSVYGDILDIMQVQREAGVITDEQNSDIALWVKDKHQSSGDKT